MVKVDAEIRMAFFCDLVELLLRVFLENYGELEAQIKCKINLFFISYSNIVFVLTKSIFKVKISFPEKPLEIRL